MIGLLHPGQMGAAVGGALVATGHRVGWASDGRSPASAQRAREFGLDDLGSLPALLAACDVVFAICPPDAAVDVAARCAGYQGIYVDANAISPETSLAIGSLIRSRGGDFVDASIIGPPPGRTGTTRLYLSGTLAGNVVVLFDNAVLSAVNLGTGSNSASALKMVYASWSKISTALLLATSETANRLGIDEALHTEWLLSQPGTLSRLDSAVGSVTGKGWRWAGEMLEIGDTFAAVGLPRGFADAAAAIFAAYPRPDNGVAP